MQLHARRPLHTPHLTDNGVSKDQSFDAYRRADGLFSGMKQEREREVRSLPPRKERDQRGLENQCIGKEKGDNKTNRSMMNDARCNPGRGTVDTGNIRRTPKVVGIGKNKEFEACSRGIYSVGQVQSSTRLKHFMLEPTVSIPVRGDALAVHVSRNFWDRRHADARIRHNNDHVFG